MYKMDINILINIFKTLIFVGVNFAYVIKQLHKF